MADEQYMQCMEVWGGSQLTTRAVQLGGLDAWVYSKPYGNADHGGDVYYASSCATGRINRLLLADVSGHGDAVAAMAEDLRRLMRRYVNFLDQTKFVRSMNRKFVNMSGAGCFATAIATTFFAPTCLLTVCNAGHPRPLLYKASDKSWSILEIERSGEREAQNIPLGILDIADYEQFDVELNEGDLVVCYTDALIESKDSNGELLGEAGLLQIAETMDVGAPDVFIKSLLAKVEERFAGNLLEDDVTVLLLQPNAKRPRVRRRQKFRAIMRLLWATIRGLNPFAERPPLPDMKLANVGGAIIPRLGKRWRPVHPLKGSRPRRLTKP